MFLLPNSNSKRWELFDSWYFHYLSLKISLIQIKLAIIDGVLHNEAFRHTGAEKEIESWTQLLQSLRLWDDLDTHQLLQFLRHRFVTGASDWLSGNHDSKQNDKETLGYTDEEWERIWTPMLEDGAWALPHLKDSMWHGKLRQGK